MAITNNTILITGGSSGLGLEMAKQFLANNNTVIICARSAEKLEEVKRNFPRIYTYQCDISDDKECESLLENIENHHAELNILINNAAIVHREPFIGDEMILDKFDKELATNFVAPVSLIKLFYPLLLGKTDAKIINITTGLVFIPRAEYTFYNATKAALHAFTKVLRHQLRNEPIEIIEVLFPAVDTPWHKGNPPKIAISPEKAVKEMVKGLASNKKEIKVGGVKILYFLSRVAPKFAFKKMNSLG